ncbi:MAG TPA: TolC family protein [Steroidobacter sp.]|nr:TolC family protein [Steroidobacter sp.]
MFAYTSERLRRRVIAGFAVVVLQAGAAVAADAQPDEWRLEDVTQMALHNRAEIAAAKARAEALAQRPAIVAALEDPMVSPSIDHYPFDMPAEEGGMGEGGGRRYDWSISVEQRFPLSGVRGHRKTAAQADALRAQAQAQGTELDVVLEVHRDFFMLLERRRMKRVLEEQMALAQQLVSVSSSRYASGLGLQSDVLRAEVEVARAQAAQQALTAQTSAAEAMLNASLGRAPQEPIPNLLHTARLDAPAAAEEVVERALLRRPELLAGEAELRRATAEVEVMRSMYKPMAMLRVGRASTMAEGAGAMVMVGVSVPIWRERLRAGVAEARAMQRMADSDLTAMRRMIEGDASAARETVSAARAQLLVLDQEVMPRARTATDAALATYSSGQGTLVSVIESARALWDVQAEHVMAESALGEAWARLERAVGAAQEQRP